MYCENLIKFIKYFGKGRKIKMCGFFILSSIAAFMEFAGIALIYPVILLLVNQEKFAGSPIYKTLENITHIHSPFGNAMLIGTGIIGIFIFKNIFMIWFLKMQWKFITYWKRDIKNRFLQYFLYSDYSRNLNLSDTDKAYECRYIVENAMDSFVLRCFNLLTNIIIIFVIISLLLIKFPLAAFTAIGFIVISLFLQDKFFKYKTLLIGKQQNKISKLYNSDFNDIFTNLKEIIIFSKQEYFYDKNVNISNEMSKLLIDFQFYTSIPPYIVEILIVTALFILTAIISIKNPGNSTEVVTSLAIVAAAIFRIAPALNRVQVSLSAINMGRDYVKKLNSNYENFNLANFKIIKAEPSKVWHFKDSIELRNINFTYKDTPVIKNLSLKIEKGDFIGVIGLSGAGKTTLADIIMGLLKLQSGEIFVDGIKLTDENYPSFRQSISYVAQEITVIDGTFKENVAWGVPENEIDEELVIKALKLAQLYDIVQTYPDGINAVPIIGKRGLSQGQKQLVAFARTLLANPKILILDEATSSIDAKTERQLQTALNELLKGRTSFIIAHRLSTIKSCDKIMYISNKGITECGTHEELLAKKGDYYKLYMAQKTE